jgi:hypothetical protein
MMHVHLCWQTLGDSCTQKINLTKNSLALCFLVLKALVSTKFSHFVFLVSRFVWARGSFTHMGNWLLHTKTKCKIKLVLPPILILVNFFSTFVNHNYVFLSPNMAKLANLIPYSLDFIDNFDMWKASKFYKICTCWHIHTCCCFILSS